MPIKGKLFYCCNAETICGGFGIRYMRPLMLEHILDGRLEPTNLPLGLLTNITDNFSEEREIDYGEFATVYKGVLPNGIVAVKKIKNFHTIHDKLFYREVNSLLTINNHPNIVRFLGFCASTDQTAIKIEGKCEYIYAEIRERLLCFEYISNGNLQQHITDELRGLDWGTRYQLIKGICDGLHYLHMEKRIYHMNLNPVNILLDNDMVPKIAGFGFARLDEKTQTTSGFGHGYLACRTPEYLCSGKMSFKSDIYSLGTIIIELVNGYKSISDNSKNNVLRRWCHRWRKTGKENPLGYQQVTKCIDIGVACLEIDPCKRPFIQEIVRDINEMEGTNSPISNDNESKVGQISPYSEDQMLGIEPLELHFPFELNKHIPCSLEITNEMGVCFAFNIQNTSSLEFCIEPNKGVVPAQSKYSVKITLQAQERAPNYMQQAYAFILQSTKVKDGLEADDITADMFKEKLDNVVDEVNLDVVLDEQLQTNLLDVHKIELPFPSETNNLMLVVFKLEVLKAITGDFSATSELGRGSYGVVYKGVFPSGEIIAVKMLKSHLVEDETFQNEVTYLMGIKHRHIVQFVGYCAESSWELMPQPIGRPVWFEVPKRFICLEYVCNKSLENYISDESIGLEWSTRYEIIKGICNGLHFLHDECRIVHLDLKPENIMMDAAMIPKISDFGLSRIFGTKETWIVTDNHLGTRGYMAPEYTIQGLITNKADIFSLGVIIIQIVTGHKEYPLSSSYFKLFNTNDSPVTTYISFKVFIEKVVGSWRKRFILMPKYKSTEKYTRQVKRCMEIALKCVDLDKDRRPTANDIIEGLTEADQDVYFDEKSAEAVISSLHMRDDQDGEESTVKFCRGGFSGHAEETDDGA